MDLLVGLSAGSEASNRPPPSGAGGPTVRPLGFKSLVLKQLALHQLAEESRVGGVTYGGSGHEDAGNSEGPSVGFLMESPEDPVRYAQEHDAPTYWSWPELTQFMEKHGMTLIYFDQGLFGHTQRKPTTCILNLPFMDQFNEARCTVPKGEPLNPDLGSRLQQTASWADWAPGLKQAIRVAIMALIKEHGLGGEYLRKAFSMDQWHQHILQGHRPFRRDCRACVLDMAADKPHRRRVGPGGSSWSMGVDVVSLVKVIDKSTSGHVRYAMVATVLVPKIPKGIREPLFPWKNPKKW